MLLYFAVQTPVALVYNISTLQQLVFVNYSLTSCNWMVSEMLNIAIVEDEWQCAKDLETCLKTYASEYKVEFNIFRYSKGTEFLFNYRSNFDIIFMDVDMPEMNGFQTAKKLRELDQNVLLIFVTFLAKYGHKGYEVDAMDYIIKPVEYETLRLKIEKAISRCRQKLNQEVMLPTREGEIRVSLSRLSYIEITGHDIVYHTDRGDFSYYGTLKMVEKLLPAGQFCRCNNGYLVNLRCVTRIEGDEVIVGDHRLQISRPRKKQFVEALHQYFMGTGV